jgi:hypothetical protein
LLRLVSTAFRVVVDVVAVVVVVVVAAAFRAG